jgi:hypothetical protein
VAIYVGHHHANVSYLTVGRGRALNLFDEEAGIVPGQLGEVAFVAEHAKAERHIKRERLFIARRV